MPSRTEVDLSNIPKHIAIIMDGNGRWAESRGLMRLKGHHQGAKVVKAIVKAAGELGVDVLTLYAFSTENWKRPATEVHGLMALLQSYLKKELANMVKDNVRLHTIGETEKLPPEVRSILREAIAKTAENTGLTLNLALSYGSRSEIVAAARQLAELVRSGALAVEEIDEERLANQLFTTGLPDPDLLIRTGGESRLSNFLLWQASYSEIYITDTHWPDFKKADLLAAIGDYQQRQRRFGKTAAQLAAKN